ncbi:MAG: hypothetical protein ACE5DN_05620, partial [Flavobacteriales bacterium]
MKNFMFPFCFLLTAHAALGTHNYAGEITYACDSLNPLKYYITITTYTKEASWQIEDCELVIGFGDNTFDTVPRSNGPAGNCAQPAKMGVPIGNDIKKNSYKTTHIYPGPGNYKLSVEVPSRSADIMNIPASVNVPFYIESELFISGFSGPCNNSVVLSFPPIDFACVMQTFITNPGAWDPDGDSLAYSLIPCKGQNGQPIPNYVYPNLVQNCEYGTFSIEPH